MQTWSQVCNKHTRMKHLLNKRLVFFFSETAGHSSWTKIPQHNVQTMLPVISYLFVADRQQKSHTRARLIPPPTLYRVMLKCSTHPYFKCKFTSGKNGAVCFCAVKVGITWLQHSKTWSTAHKFAWSSQTCGHLSRYLKNGESDLFYITLTSKFV